MMIGAGLLMVGLLVVIHEAGHMLVAKALGIGVPVFSVGMGPRLFGVVAFGTDFRVSAIPVGGYVRLSGADPFGDADTDDEGPARQDFMLRPVWQRLAVMAAGPGANLLLPIALFTAVLMGGEPQADATVGLVDPEGAAWAAGLREGDLVRRVGQRDVGCWSDVIDALIDGGSTATVLHVQRDGRELDVVLPAEALVFRDGLLDGDALGAASDRMSSSVGVDDPASPAARAGMQTADRVVVVDGQTVRDWRALTAHLGPGAHRVEVDRVVDGQIHRVALDVLATGWRADPTDPWANDWGVVPLQMFVRHVVPDGAARAAGVLPADRLWSVDGVVLPDWASLSKRIQALVPAGSAQARTVQLELVRAGERVTVHLVPTMVRELVHVEARYRPMIGVQRWDGAFVGAPDVRRYYGPLEALERSLFTSRRVLVDTLTLFGNLTTGNVKVDEGLGGPVEIFRHAARSAEEGVFAFARMMGMLSFSLGIVNLLPVPVLDGGHILFYTLEAIRGRPLPVRVRERLQMAGVLALVALMLYVTWGEVLDAVRG